MIWQQLRVCRSCEEPKPLARFQLVRNRGQRPCRRRVCWDCRLPDLAAYNRASRDLKKDKAGGVVANVEMRK
jgi:hypothetical protein